MTKYYHIIKLALSTIQSFCRRVISYERVGIHHYRHDGENERMEGRSDHLRCLGPKIGGRGKTARRCMYVKRKLTF
jgi:hypothetical protein